MSVLLSDWCFYSSSSTSFLFLLLLFLLSRVLMEVSGLLAHKDVVLFLPGSIKIPSSFFLFFLSVVYNVFSCLPCNFMLSSPSSFSSSSPLKKFSPFRTSGPFQFVLSISSYSVACSTIIPCLSFRTLCFHSSAMCVCIYLCVNAVCLLTDGRCFLFLNLLRLTTSECFFLVVRTPFQLRDTLAMYKLLYKMTSYL